MGLVARASLLESASLHMDGACALLFSVGVLPRLKDLIGLGASHPLPVKYRGHGKVVRQVGHVMLPSIP